MKISELFNRTSYYDTTKAGEAGRAGNASAEEEARRRSGSESGEDTVSISPLAKQYGQVSKILSEDATTRSQRVAALKDQVAKGEYHVSSEDTAKSLIGYFSKDSE